MQTLHFSNKTYSKILHIPSLVFALVLLICLASPSSSCTKQEENSLRQFLAELSQDGGLTASWRNGTDCCQWEGITCSTDEIVTDVLLASRSLEGQISPSLGNLTFLQSLALAKNSLTGEIPHSLGHICRLKTLRLYKNTLQGNMTSFTNCSKLRELDVSCCFAS